MLRSGIYIYIERETEKRDWEMRHRLPQPMFADKKMKIIRFLRLSHRRRLDVMQAAAASNIPFPYSISYCYVEAVWTRSRSRLWPEHPKLTFITKRMCCTFKCVCLHVCCIFFSFSVAIRVFSSCAHPMPHMQMPCFLPSWICVYSLVPACIVAPENLLVFPFGTVHGPRTARLWYATTCSSDHLVMGTECFSKWQRLFGEFNTLEIGNWTLFVVIAVLCALLASGNTLWHKWPFSISL